MQQPRPFYRARSLHRARSMFVRFGLLICLSLSLLLTGQGAAPAQPPTPAEQQYNHWDQHNPPSARQVSTADLQTKHPAQVLQNLPKFGQSNLYYTALTFSGLSGETSWNEDIYFTKNMLGNLNYEMVKLNSDPGLDFTPRMNKTGTEIVFVSDRSSTSKTTIYNIYSMSTTGANQRQLTASPGLNLMPSFSPDGQKIVFVSTRDGNAEIYTMNRDGSSPVRLTAATEADVQPDWSPDGKSIVWVRRVSTNSGVLMVMAPDGSNQHAITAPIRYPGNPNWSNSGQKIALQMDVDGDGWYELATLDASGANFMVLPIAASGYADLEMGSWLPDDAGLVYNQIDYVPSNGDWYTSSSEIKMTSFANLGEIETLHISTIFYDPITYNPNARLLDETPPFSWLHPLPAYSKHLSVPLLWDASDDNSGICTTTIQVKTDQDPTWRDFYSSPIPYSRSNVDLADTGYVNYPGQVGEKAYFRTQARDCAMNTEPLKSYAEVETKIYESMAKTTVTDARNYPILGAVMQPLPELIDQPVSDEKGILFAAFTGDGPYKVIIQHTGFAPAPEQIWDPVDIPTNLNTLTGLDEQVTNGQFNGTDDPLTGWQSTGTVPVTTYIDKGFSARKGAFLHKILNNIFGFAQLEQPLTIPSDMASPTLSFFYYKTAAWDNDPIARFEVTFTPQGGQPVVLFQTVDLIKDFTYGPFTHVWTDLTPYAGQSGILAFRLVDGTQYFDEDVVIDDVSVASWTSPILTSLTPNNIPTRPEADTWIDLEGENFLPGVMIYLTGEKAETTQYVSSTHLRLMIPAGQPVGKYQVKVVNPSGAFAIRPLTVGSFLYTPKIMK